MSANQEIAVVLLSGGLDSCVCTAIAARDHDLAALHVSYGQRTEARELLAFHAIADHYGVARRLTITLDSLQQIGGSSLTDHALPVGRANFQSDAIPDTYVPFRNAHFLSAGASWAEAIGATALYIGAVEADSPGYPDCRKTFFRAFAQAITLGTRPDTQIEICTPLIDMSKHEIVRLGRELGAPIALTWSCYQDSELACGQCDSCALRLRGHAEAGLEDPIAYQSRHLRDQKTS